MRAGTMNGVRNGHAWTARWSVAPILTLVSGALCLGATVTLGSLSPGSGYIAVPISMTPGTNEHVASLQFDMAFDGTAFQIDSVKPGTSALNASKDIMFSTPGDGTVRVIVAGLNQNVVGEGIIATVYLTRTTADASLPVVGLDAIVVSDPVGQPLHALYQNDSEPESSGGDPSPEDASSAATSAADTTTTAKEQANSAMGDAAYSTISPGGRAWPGVSGAESNAPPPANSPEYASDPAGANAPPGSSRLNSGRPVLWDPGDGPAAWSGRQSPASPGRPRVGAPSPAPGTSPLSQGANRPPDGPPILATGVHGPMANAASPTAAAMRTDDGTVPGIARPQTGNDTWALDFAELAWPLAIAALGPLFWFLRPRVLKRIRK